MNFVVTHFTSWFNEAAYNFTHNECEEHFYPEDSRSKTEVGYASLDVFDFSGLLLICFSMILLSALVLFCEIAFFKFQENDPAKNHTKVIHFSNQSKFTDNFDALRKFSEFKSSLLEKQRDCLVIVHFEGTTRVISDDSVEISISLVLQLKIVDEEQRILEKLRDFSDYLESISKI